MIATHHRPAILASVTTPAEAVLAHSCGADIIDAKDPALGALGALPVATVAAIRNALPPHVIVSATIGDLPFEPGRVCAAVTAMAASGCDIIKIGVFPGEHPPATFAALSRLALGRVKLAGLLLADMSPDFGSIRMMADAGFAGVMLDTAGKSGGALTSHLDVPELALFIARAHAANLFAGLAGSLRLSHIALLMPLRPDVMGFRGALCDRGDRTRPMVPQRVREVRAAFDEGGARQAPGNQLRRAPG